jgi:methyl-accepting chemotaxis protein
MEKSKYIALSIAILLLSSCSSVKERQNRVIGWLNLLRGVGSGNVLEEGTETVYEIGNGIKDTIEMGKGIVNTVKETVEDVNTRVQKVKDGVNKIQEGRALIEDGVGVDLIGD